MKKNYTHISMLVDRSGSMDTIREETISAINDFITTQAKLPGEATLSLSVFNERYTPIFTARNVKDIGPITDVEFAPAGYTALVDAFATFISETGAALATLGDASRPEKVVFVVLTDGMDNASKETRVDALRALVTQQKEKYSWEFLFLGANIDAIATGNLYGASGAMSYTSSGRGVVRGGQAVGAYVAASRRGASATMDLMEISGNVDSDATQKAIDDMNEEIKEQESAAKATP